VKSVRNIGLVADAARSVQAHARELGFVASGSANRSIEDASAGDILQEYERRVKNPRLRLATRTRFRSGHYADAVESGVKALNECVRALSGSTEDGDGLMTSVFSEKKPKLRINRLRTDSDKSEQRGHMMMCQGVVAGWRNPRAHSTSHEDSAESALSMLEHIDYLMRVTEAATRTRQRRQSRP
jgi:uncharacterized protein (TIGR02391 family)